MAHIAIVGAGLIGRLTALQLTGLNHHVTLFDKESAQGQTSAAYTAAGLLTPYGESLGTEKLVVDMGVSALRKWPVLLSKLDHHVDFSFTGSICVSHQQDIGDYRRFHQHIKQYYPQSQLSTLNKAQLSTLEPELVDKFNGGIFVPNEGVINNHQLLAALTHQLSNHALVTWHENVEVAEVKSHQVTITSGQSHAFDLVIDSRGTGSPISGLRAVRGEVIYLHAPAVNIARPIRLMHPRYKLYIAPKHGQHYAIGATEIESSDYRPITVQSSLELLSAIYSVHKGFAEAHITQQFANCRPAFNDNLPRVVSQKGLIQINGLYRHGFLLAPEVVDIAVSEIQ